MVPSGWKQVTLDDASTIIDCKHRTPSYVSEGVPLVSPGTIKWGALDLLTPSKRVEKHEYESLMDHCTVDIGDLVLSRNQSVGIASYVMNDQPFVLGQDTVLVKPKKTNSQFLFFKLQSDEVQRNIYKISGGSTFSRINLGDIRKLKFELPPLPEQTKIAQILSTWDKAITNTEQLIINSQQQKKALMQQLLTGKKRLAGYSVKWRAVTINTMGKVVSGGTPDTKNAAYWNGDVLWMTPTDVTALKTKFIYDTTRKITEEGVGNSSATILPSGTLLVCTRATVGLISISTTEITTNQGFKSLIPNTKFDASFLYYLFSMSKREFIRYACGSTFLELSKKDFEKLSFKCPRIEEQQEISTVLSISDREIDALKQKLNFLKQEKKALMQQLLTGKRRVIID